MSAEVRPRLAITLGDAAGIGPEVCLKAGAELVRTLHEIAPGEVVLEG